MKNINKLIKIWSTFSAKEKIIIGKEKSNFGYDESVALAILIITNEDFNINEETDNVVYDNTDSYQIRPKALYRNSNGIYYKEDGKRKFLSEKEIIELKKGNQKLGKYL